MRPTCSRCFVTTDFPGTVINAEGLCGNCASDGFAISCRERAHRGLHELQQVAESIRGERTGKYDCVIGSSGGLDSSYVAYVCKKRMNLNPLLVSYDHTMFWDQARRNVDALAKSLGCDLQIVRSSGSWDRKYVSAFVKAVRHVGLYWGICEACHFVLPAAVRRRALEEGIRYTLVSSNKFEETLRVPGRVRLRAMATGLFSMPLHLPLAGAHLLASRYYLLRLRQEFRARSPFHSIRSDTVKLPKAVNVSDYVPWNIDEMIHALETETGWRLPDHDNLGMRFDCRIEDSLINHTYKCVTGQTIHGIIANNLIYAGLRVREQLEPAVRHYDRAIVPGMNSVFEDLGISTLEDAERRRVGEATE